MTKKYSKSKHLHYSKKNCLIGLIDGFLAGSFLSLYYCGLFSGFKLGVIVVCTLLSVGHFIIDLTYVFGGSREKRKKTKKR